MSGRIFSLNYPVDTLKAQELQAKIIIDIKNIYPMHEVIPIGSVGKRESTYMHEDIDIAVEASDIDELYNIVSSVFPGAVKKESLYIVSIPYIYEEGKHIQVDFILMTNPEWTKFRYYCPDYSKGESKYKVGPKIMLTNLLLNHCYDIINELNEDPIHLHAMLDYSPTGLYVTTFQFTNDGTRISSDRFVSDDPSDIPLMLFGLEGRMEWMNTVESIWEAIHSEHFQYKDRLPYIERNWFINCFKKGWTSIRPEDFKLEHCTVEEINNALLEYIKLHNINRMFNPDEKNV